mgnify:CR=1 FL=1
MPENEVWLTTGQVAELFRVDRSTVYRLSKDKLVFKRSPGGQRRYKLSDVHRYGREVMQLDFPDESLGQSGVNTP